MEFDTVYTEIFSWCCEIAIGTKNSSFISLQVMFFKCDKSTMEKWSNIFECDLVTWNFCAIVSRFVLKF